VKLLSVSIFLAAMAGLLPTSAGSSQELPIHDGVGGEFIAPESSLGKPVALSDYRGKAVFIFFGYTSCNDVCPATLSHLNLLFKQLGPASDDVQVLFVTVDPETDTGEFLKEYLEQFDSRFVGLTGEPADINDIAKKFMAEHNRSHDVEISTEYNRAKTFTEQSYLYSHSQQIYLLDKEGRTRAFFFTGSPVEEMKEAVLALLKESPPPAN
jgi:protein SCO1/2